MIQSHAIRFQNGSSTSKFIINKNDKNVNVRAVVESLDKFSFYNSFLCSFVHGNVSKQINGKIIHKMILCSFHFGVIASCALCSQEEEGEKWNKLLYCVDRVGNVHVPMHSFSFHRFWFYLFTLCTFNRSKSCSFCIHTHIKTTPKGFVTSRICTKCTVILPHGPGWTLFFSFLANCHLWCGWFTATIVDTPQPLFSALGTAFHIAPTALHLTWLYKHIRVWVCLCNVLLLNVLDVTRFFFFFRSAFMLYICTRLNRHFYLYPKAFNNFFRSSIETAFSLVYLHPIFPVSTEQAHHSA